MAVCPAVKAVGHFSGKADGFHPRQPVLGFRGLFEAMSLVAIVALAAYLFVSRKRGTMRRRLKEADEP